MASGERRGNRNDLELTRLKAVRMVQSGMPNVEVAAVLGVNAHTVSDWMTVFRAHGIMGLMSKGKRGQPSRISNEQCDKLDLIITKGAAAYGYDIGRWTVSSIRKVIVEEFGISYSTAHTWKILQSMGWSTKKPKTKHEMAMAFKNAWIKREKAKLEEKEKKKEKERSKEAERKAKIEAQKEVMKWKLTGKKPR